MIDNIQGAVEEINEMKAVIRSGKIAFSLSCSNITLSELNAAEGEVKVYTYLSMKDTGIELYGFSGKTERDMFFRLISVSKVGPKLALSILSLYTPSELILHIVSGESQALAKAAGVGKKLAENIVLNLKDKFSDAEIAAADGFTAAFPAEQNDIRAQAMSALMSLGFDRSISASIINSVYVEDITVEELISRALQRAGN